MSEQGEKNKGGRPAFVMDDEKLAQIEALGSVLSIEQIADYFGIGKTTFYRVVERQPEVMERYKRGQAKAIGSVAQSLLTQAREGNLTAAIFYLKTRAGWRETQVVDNVSSDGSMTPKAKEIEMSKEDLQGALSEALKEIAK
jgi:phage-related putative DNA binding protein|nr:MAG TPA: Sf6 terminase small subunit gp1, octamer, DNA-binding, CAPS buffer.65A [Caudoviricetes sp.]